MEETELADKLVEFIEEYTNKEYPLNYEMFVPIYNQFLLRKKLLKLSFRFLYVNSNRDQIDDEWINDAMEHLEMLADVLKQYSQSLEELEQ